MQDKDILWLLSEIIDSFSSGTHGIGIPLGNLTSPLFANVYMNEFDQFVKQVLRERWYIRYADDFVIMSEDRTHLESLVPHIQSFLLTCLKLILHPKKILIRTIASGVDFLGWMHFPDHRVLRRTTKNRLIQSVRNNKATIGAYNGLLIHGNTHKVQKMLNGYNIGR